MKIASVADMKARLSAYLKASEEGPVVVTRNGKAVAVLLGIEDEDELERLVLAYSKRFRCLQVLAGHTDSAYCGLLTADGRRALSGSRDGTVRVWDVATGRCLRVIGAHAYHVQCLAWSADQRRVLSCDERACLRRTFAASERRAIHGAPA